MKIKVITKWENGKPIYQEGEDVTPSYSRSGLRVIKIEDRFFVQGFGSNMPDKWFNTLKDAWNHCEKAYYSY